ncbi:tetratricopeptide repeat protein [Helicobacter pylori]|uniref:tetratricopeptide repeat protein n=1 Tax=Helicobacter pylori TaxID=210 RepID=UPI0039EE9460
MFECVVFRGVNGKIDPGYAKALVNRGKESYDKQDFTQAKKYFKKACDLKEGMGCYNLGVLYQNGEGVEKNLKKAAQYYKKACV